MRKTEQVGSMKPAACALSMALAIVAFSLAKCASAPERPEGHALAGSARCATCHEQEARFCRYGAHRTVECERCHGPGARHAAVESGPRPALSLGDVGLCLSCHGEAADPSSDVTSTIESFEDHLRKLEREHRIKLDREKSGTDCVYCHDPHLLE